MMNNEIATNQLFYSSLDEFSPTYDFSTNGVAETTLPNDHVIFPGDRDTMSMYLHQRHKGIVKVFQKLFVISFIHIL